jgi:acetylornithine deacetylase
MKAATSERGLLVIDAEAKGVSGHAARNEGINALYIALDDIRTLRSHEFVKVSEKMGKVHLNVTQIQAGCAHNVIPDSCRFVIDIRPNEKYTNCEILRMLQEICGSTLTARNLENRSSATFEDSTLQKVAEALGIETFSSPTTSDWMRIDCDAVKMGPGDSARSHKKDEYITVKEIKDAVKTYIKFITNICQNK